MAKGPRIPARQDFFAEGNNGGSYINIQHRSEGMVYLEVGETCIKTVREQISVCALAAILTACKDEGFQKIIDRYFRQEGVSDSEHILLDRDISVVNRARNVKPKSATLDFLFGADSTGETPFERAKTSKTIFVRGYGQVAHDSAEAKGVRISATDALVICGWDGLAELIDKGSGSPIISRESVGTKFTERRREKGLSQLDLAKLADVPLDVIVQIETFRRHPPTAHQALAVAEALGYGVTDF